MGSWAAGVPWAAGLFGIGGVVWLLAVAGLACSACSATGGGSVSASMGELTNPFLGPDYSDWLVGPVSRMASADEIKAYLGLRDDGLAVAFIQHFWERHNPTRGPANPVLAVFEERRAAADQKFSEGGVLGHRTDRGTILVLYGPPLKTGFEVPPAPNQPAIEVWRYSPKAPAGLDGKSPAQFYRFAKRGDLTVMYVPRPGSRLVTGAPPP